MLERCLTWDTRSQTCEPEELNRRLNDLSPEEGLLVISKTSFLTPWSGTSYPLIDGPSIYFRLHLHSLAGDDSLAPLIARQLGWLKSLRDLRLAAQQGQPYTDDARQLIEEILRELDIEEKQMYTPLERWLGNGRPTRELGYEHLGIRRGIPRLLEALEAVASGQPVKVWERFSLDVIHLIEHHLEHDHDGPYPVYERLAQK